MGFEDALGYKLVNTSAITNLVDERIYQATDVSQRTERPYLTFQRISGPRHRHQTGAGLCEPRYQFSAIADKVDDARDIADAVRATFDRYRGQMGRAGSTVAVRGAFVQDDSVVPIIPTDASQRGPQQRSVDIIFWYVES
jgi:hypothetical protein